MDFYSKITGLTITSSNVTSPEVIALITELENSVFDKPSEELLKIYKHEKRVKKIREKYYEYILALEEYAYLLTIKSHKVDENLKRLPHFWYVWEQIDRECKLLKKYKPIKSAVFIGGGVFPLTAILLYKNGFSSISCLDIDNASVKKSNTLFKKLGISEYIHSVYIDGANYNYSSSDAIIVAAALVNRKRVVERITSTAPSGSKLVLRLLEQRKHILFNTAFPFEEVYGEKFVFVDSCSTPEKGTLSNGYIKAKIFRKK